jgi:hypothetical protein
MFDKQYYLPQFDHALYLYWSSVDSVKVEYLYMPILLKEVETDSMFHLMFNNAYNHNYYNYLFISQNSLDLPSSVVTRLYLKTPINKYYITTSEDNTLATNLLNITNEERDMLDKLLVYRMNMTCDDLTSVNYNDLTSDFSKLCYIYLDCLVNKNYLDNINKVLQLDITDKRIFVKAFELYVKNEFHNLLKDLSVLIDNSVVRNYLYCVVLTCNQTTNNVDVPINKPLLTDMNTVVKVNGVFIPSNLYVVEVDDTLPMANIEFLNMELKEGDVVYFSYFSSTLVNESNISSEVINQLRPNIVNLHELVM